MHEKFWKTFLAKILLTANLSFEDNNIFLFFILLRVGATLRLNRLKLTRDCYNIFPNLFLPDDFRWESLFSFFSNKKRQIKKSWELFSLQRDISDFSDDMRFIDIFFNCSFDLKPNLLVIICNDFNDNDTHHFSFLISDKNIYRQVYFWLTCLNRLNFSAQFWFQNQKVSKCVKNILTLFIFCWLFNFNSFLNLKFKTLKEYFLKFLNEFVFLKKLWKKL